MLGHLKNFLAIYGVASGVDRYRTILHVPEPKQTSKEENYKVSQQSRMREMCQDLPQRELCAQKAKN